MSDYRAAADQRSTSDYYDTGEYFQPGDLRLVREQLFLLAHDEDNHLRPRLHVPALGVGLAGAGIIDLMVAHRIHISNGRAYVSDLYDTQGSGDPVTDHVLQRLRSLRAAPLLPALLRELGPDLYPRTLGALTAQGVITQGRRFGRIRYEVARPALANRIRGKVRYRINGNDRPKVDTDALCALISALNLQDCLIFQLSRDQTDDLLFQIATQIPSKVMVGDPVAAIPKVAYAVHQAVGDLATAPF